MKVFRQILIVMVLLATSLPCLHAEVHERHMHADAYGTVMCAEPMHTSACHTCSETVCDLKILRVHVSSAQHLALPASPVPLFVLSEKRPAIRQPALAASGALFSLQTIRLLI